MPEILKFFVSGDDGAVMNGETGDANEAKVRKLHRNSLRRLARRRGLNLRESYYGFSLVDGFKNRVEGRSDMTLGEIEAYLTRQP